ncbi:MAG: hypothetical protein Q7V63_01755 [Gammaproteobacteria bacterium]|nr:hypothetical protein [Gammaproteobacteria bacterium]
MQALGFSLCRLEYARVLETSRIREIPDDLKKTWVLIQAAVKGLEAGISHEQFCNYCERELTSYKALPIVHELLTIVAVVESIVEMPEVFEYCFTEMINKKNAKHDERPLALICHDYFPGYAFIEAMFIELTEAITGEYAEPCTFKKVMDSPVKEKGACCDPR